MITQEEDKLQIQPNTSHLPSKEGRYIVLDTEATGPTPKDNNIIEIACVEILDGKITGNEFHAFLHPRYEIQSSSSRKHKLSNDFFETYFNDVYTSDKKSLEIFLKFLGKSLIFAHNAATDIQFINNELNYWGIPPIQKKRFRCTMQIFRDLYPSISKNCCSLNKYCEFFNLASPSINYHSAIFDSFMTARVVCKFFECRENLEKDKGVQHFNNLSSKDENINEEKDEEGDGDAPIELEETDILDIIKGL